MRDTVAESAQRTLPEMGLRDAVGQIGRNRLNTGN